MKKKRLTNRTLSRWILLLLMLVTGTTQGVAQNVTIGPNNGSFITGQAGGNVDDSGIKRGMASMWIHEQLQLTMTTSDIANLTSAGELADPSCAIDKMTFNGEERLIIGAGQTQTFMVVSLPKGYRITSYRLVLQPNVYGNNIRLHEGKNTWNIGSDDQLSFYETPAWSNGTPYGNNTHSTQLNCPDAIATATASDGSTVMQNNNDENRNKEFVIERTNNSTVPMTNQLHFFFARGTSEYAVSIKSFEIYFTAQGTFEADVLPVESGPAVSALQSPFSTSKMDIGAIAWNDDAELYCYDYTNVRDLIAYNWLYQTDAISGGKPADVATNKHISPVEVDGLGAYAFGNDTYFIEPPTTIHTATGAEAPIGYRIVGATFDYKWGTATVGGSKSISNGYRVRVRYSGNDYYLNDNLDFVQPTDESPAFVWQVDEFGNLYTGTEYKRYLACFGEGDNRIISLSSSASGHEATWNLKVDNYGRVYYYSDGQNYYYLHYRRGQEGSAYHLRGYVTKNYDTSSNDIATASSTGSQNITIPSFTPGAYKLEIFGTDKETPVETVTVNSAADANVYELTGLNNDAVKFRISNLADGTQALVNVTLKLEALNPYIDKMDVVCHDAINSETGKPTLELSQPFTASDFSVSGGKFIFYVPSDYSDDLLTFTFSNLYSHYGDNTYYTGTPDQTNETARYSFVTSDYFFPVNGNGNGGLYDNAYNPDALYTTKVFTSTAGNIRFKFNNAEEVNASGGTLQEYPFSVTKYLGSADPDHSSKTGSFIQCQLRADAAAGTQNTGIFYVFTADETRYNIAPTTALQHRSYAFYRMDIELRAKTFTPNFTWKEIYPATLYDKDGTDAEDSMWGLTLDTSDTEVVDGETVKMESYLTYQEILDAITADINNTAKETASSMKQILYVDGTPLKAMLNSSQNSVVKKLEDLKAELPANALVFLPKNTTSTLDNVAYMTTSGAFRAGKDIILTDKQPFYSPYDIQVDAANRATYTRLLTQPDFGQAVNATVMLPFTLALENGLHTNDDGKCSFYVSSMETNAQMATEGSSSVNYGTAYFKPLTTSVSVANKPYVIKVESIDESVSNGNKISFIATQKGSSIVKTPASVTESVFSGSFIKGETAQAKYKDVNYYFTNYASYSGGKFDRAVSENVFYFSKNKYVDLHTLYPGTLQHLMSYPFRGVYTYSTSAPASGAKLMNGFYISYDLDDMESAGFATRLEQLGTKADMMIRSGKGFITIATTADQKFVIRTLNGMAVKNVDVNAGNTTTVNLPAGIYLVNNTKITVK